MTKNSENEYTGKLKKEALKRMSETMPIGFRTTSDNKTAEGNAMAMSKQAQSASTLKRVASALMGSGGGAFQANVPKGPLLYVDPLFDPILFLFPKDRLDEINKRLRHYYEHDEIVGGAIDTHTLFPLSDFYLECENPENQKYWNDWKDRVGLVESLRCLVHDHFLLGEGVLLPIWDQYNFEISHFNQYPPENVDIIQTYVTPKKMFMLKPDPKLIDKLKSSNDGDRAIMAMMDPEYVESLENGKPFFLGTDDKVMYLARQTTKYRQRGVSLLSRALKNLLYKDKLRMLQLTFVDRHYAPLKIFKVGSESRGWIPNKAHFSRLQSLLAQAQGDPDFNLIWHFGLQVDYVGTKDKIMNLIPEFEWIEKQIMAALFVNEEIIHGGLPSAVRDTVNMRTLMHRYNDVREKIERMLITHVFLPMARARGFYRKGGEAKAKAMEDRFIKVAGKEYKAKCSEYESNEMFRIANSQSGSLDLSAFDIPRPIWKKINLVNNAAEQQLIMSLESDGKLPMETVLDMLGFDPKTIKAKLKAQESTPFDPLYREIRSELGKTEGIRQQVLSGAKLEEWIKPDEAPEDEPLMLPGLGGKPTRKSPSMPSPGAGGSFKPPERPKMPPSPASSAMDTGAAGGPPKAPINVKSPAEATSTLPGIAPIPPMPAPDKAPGSENAPGVGG